MNSRDKLLLDAFAKTAAEKTSGKRAAVLEGKITTMESYRAETAYIRAWDEAAKLLSTLLNKDFDTDLGEWTSGTD